MGSIEFNVNKVYMLFIDNQFLLLMVLFKVFYDVIVGKINIYLFLVKYVL